MNVLLMISSGQDADNFGARVMDFTQGRNLGFDFGFDFFGVAKIATL